MLCLSYKQTINRFIFRNCLTLFAADEVPTCLTCHSYTFSLSYLSQLHVMAQQVGRGQGPRKRHWCFTSYLVSLPISFDPNIVRYCIYQREICPESKKEHFQGYIELYDNKRVRQVKRILGECHLEPRRGSRDSARLYCTKEESAIKGTQVEFGMWREDITRKRKLCDLLKQPEMTLDDLIAIVPHEYCRYHRGMEKLFMRRAAAKAKEFRTVIVDVYVGPTGSGKTKKASEFADHYFMPASDTLWFDGYEGQKVLVIDDFYGNIKYGIFLRMLDGYELQMPIKGGFVWAQWVHVIITSNAEPKDWYQKGLTPALARRITNITHLFLPIVIE